jgi:superfamily II DNA/RNA helicase
MNNFSSLGLPAFLQSSLLSLNLKIPTPIQAKAIPIALEHRDIIASANTGTGKTLAFLIPLIVKLIDDPKSNALILTPTREIAVQIAGVISQLLNKNRILSHLLLIGGENISRQLQQLRSKPRIIVGTPGRVNDHLSRKSLRLNHTNILVLDETDRMLDMGFGIQLNKIIPHLAKSRQTLMFSATFPEKIIQLAKKYMHNPERIAIGQAKNPIVENLKQSTIKTNQDNKYNTLLQALDNCQGSVLVFVNTKRGVEKLANKLKTKNYSVDALHGDLRQNKRAQIVKNFRAKNFRIMVATDIAARGLDIPHIEYVINYELPKCPEDYIHRIGRTARSNASGTALNLISQDDNRRWKSIQKLIGSS